MTSTFVTVYLLSYNVFKEKERKDGTERNEYSTVWCKNDEK